MTTPATALITFDVEEFDAPMSYGAGWSISEQLDLGVAGWVKSLTLPDDRGIRTTLFTTATIGLHAPELMRAAIDPVSHLLAAKGMLP